MIYSKLEEICDIVLKVSATISLVIVMIMLCTSGLFALSYLLIHGLSC